MFPHFHPPKPEEKEWKRSGYKWSSLPLPQDIKRKHSSGHLTHPSRGGIWIKPSINLWVPWQFRDSLILSYRRIGERKQEGIADIGSTCSTCSCRPIITNSVLKLLELVTNAGCSISGFFKSKPSWTTCPRCCTRLQANGGATRTTICLASWA